MGEPEPLADEEFALLRTCLSTITDPRQRRGRVHPLEGVLSLSVLGRSVELERVGSDGPLPLLERNPAVWRITPGSAAGVEAAAQPFRAHPGQGAPRGLSSRSERGPAHLHPATPQDEGPGKGMTVAADGKSCRAVWEEGRQLGLVHSWGWCICSPRRPGCP